MNKALSLVISHSLFAIAGFALGIYVLPIITAPVAPTDLQMAAAQDTAQFSGQFRRDLKDSDFLHWGEGTISVGQQFISLQGELAPGPDYNLYLSPQFVETEAEFARLKPQMVRVGDVKTFENFVVPMPPDVDPSAFDTVIVWCESFEQFITAAQYQ